MDEVKDNTYEVERVICPQITSAKDIVDAIGSLSVEILNKDKVIGQLWNNIDEQTSTIASQGEEISILKGASLTDNDTLVAKDKTIEDLLSSKEKVRENSLSIEKTFNEDIQKLRDEHQIQINTKDGEIQDLQKVLASIEAEAVVNQEEIRKELMETQNEIDSLRKSLRPPRKVTKKKKTNAKPARA